MIEWMSSKVATSMVVLIIALSFMGLFGLQVESYREMERSAVADRVSSLVAEVDRARCEVAIDVDLADPEGAYGIPRLLHGEVYSIELTRDRAYVVVGGQRTGGAPFSCPVRLVDGYGEPVELLVVPSTGGFVISSQEAWCDWGLDLPVTIGPLR